MTESSRSETFLPYTGVLAGALFGIATWVPQVSEKYADPAGMQIMNDHATRNFVAVAASAFFCVAMVWFVSVLRDATRPADGTESVFTNALFAGGVLVAGSQAAAAWIMLSALDAADHGDEASFQALSYLGIDGWMLWVAGSAVFYLAAGVAALRTPVLPRWLAIAAVVLGILCVLGPAGIAVFLVTPLWLVLAGVLLRPGSSSRAAAAVGVQTPVPAGR